MENSTGRAGARPKGLTRALMVETAITLMEESGASGFSVRKLGERIGCDPMSVLYHFKSKEGLLRAMADALTARLVPVDRELPWQKRLHALAAQYRSLALEYRQTFVLMQRFINTGTADVEHIESVHAALAEAGVEESRIPSLCIAWYATVIGLCMGEINGLVRPASQAEISEMSALSADRFPHLSASANRYADIDPAYVFESAMATVISGLQIR